MRGLRLLEFAEVDRSLAVIHADHPCPDVFELGQPSGVPEEVLL